MVGPGEDASFGKSGGLGRWGRHGKSGGLGERGGLGRRGELGRRGGCARASLELAVVPSCDFACVPPWAMARVSPSERASRLGPASGTWITVCGALGGHPSFT